MLAKEALEGVFPFLFFSTQPPEGREKERQEDP